MFKCSFYFLHIFNILKKLRWVLFIQLSYDPTFRFFCCIFRGILVGFFYFNFFKYFLESTKRVGLINVCQITHHLWLIFFGF